MNLKCALARWSCPIKAPTKYATEPRTIVRWMPHAGLAKNLPYDIVPKVPVVPHMSCVYEPVSELSASIDTNEFY